VVAIDRKLLWTLLIPAAAAPGGTPAVDPGMARVAIAD
jgi:hypothetical protein